MISLSFKESWKSLIINQKRIILLFIILLTLSYLFALKEYRVAVLYWSMNIPGQVAMRKGIESEAEKINAYAKQHNLATVRIIPRVAGDGEVGIKNQIKQFKEVIGLKPNLIIVQPTDNAALADGLKLANRMKIPVVTYDQYISGGKLAAYRTSDNYQAGYLDGEYIASKYSQNGKQISIVLVEYPHVSSTVERLNGFLDGLSKSGCNFRILKSYIAVEPVSGKKAVSKMLKDFPIKGSIDVVFCVNDGGGLAVVEGLKRAGRKEIKVASIDGDPLSVQNIKTGNITVIDAAQFCGPLGSETMRCSYNILLGKKVPYHALVPVFPICKETLKLYPGWKGPIPAGFKKSWKSTSPYWKSELRIVKS